MEINITKFFNEANPHDFSASRAEKGEEAGTITWNAAKEAVDEHLMLDTSAKVEALRDHARGFGAWSDEEIDGWTVQECNALLIQMISGDIKEAPGLDPSDWDWDAYEKLAEKGTCGGRMFKGTDGEIYYYLGT
jgi:hypothetical protein